jgi:hypothetical protein
VHDSFGELRKLALRSSHNLRDAPMRDFHPLRASIECESSRLCVCTWVYLKRVTGHKRKHSKPKPDSCTSNRILVMMDQFCGLLSTIEGEEDKLSQPSSNKTIDDDDGISPFLAYEDGYLWPDLYSELDEMLEHNVLIYPLAELRKMAREGTLTSTESSLAIPLTYATLMDVVEANQKQLEETSFGDGFYLENLKTLEERNMMPRPSNKKEGNKEESVPTNLSPSTIIAFDDEFAEVWAHDIAEQAFLIVNIKT